MSTTPDYLEMLITDIRKTISDNKLFLKTLKNDQDTVVADEDEVSGKVTTEDDFEEL